MTLTCFLCDFHTPHFHKDAQTIALMQNGKNKKYNTIYLTYTKTKTYNGRGCGAAKLAHMLCNHTRRALLHGASKRDCKSIKKELSCAHQDGLIQRFRTNANDTLG